MRLILHVGTHKTGTTSIQAALASNRQWLAERDYIFPPLCGSQTSHNEFAHRIALATPEGLDELRSMLVSASDPDRITIVSGEEMSARIAGTRDWDGYSDEDYWDRRLEYLQRVRAVVQDFDEITVHLCLRRADGFAESIYATMMLSRRGRFRGSFERFISAVAPIFEYQRQIDLFRRMFEDVRVISFDVLASDLVPGFFRWTDIPMPPDTTQRRKITPDKRLVYWFSRMVETCPHDEVQCRLWAQFVASGQNKQLFLDRGPATFWSSQTSREAFARRSAEGLPDGFFGCPPAREFTEARLDDTGLARISDAFASWRAATKTRRRTIWFPVATFAVTPRLTSHEYAFGKAGHQESRNALDFSGLARHSGG